MLEEGRKSGHEIEKELGIGSGQVERRRKALETEGKEGNRCVSG
jgi:biotin operon repressor